MKTSRIFGFVPYPFFVFLILALASIATLESLVIIRHHFFAAGDNVYPEATGIVSAIHWAHGLPLYTDFHKAPYILTAFPPLWYLCLRMGMVAGFTSVDSVTFFARGLSLAFLFGIALLSYLWNRRRGYSVGESLLSPMLYLAFPALLPWAVSARPDFPALFFGLVALVAITLRPKADGVALAGFFAGIAFLFRHSCVAVPTAIGISLLLTKRWRDTAILCASWAVPVFLILWRFNSASQGQMRASLSGSNFGSMNLGNTHEILNHLLTREGYGFSSLLLAMGIFGLVFAWNKSEDGATKILFFYAVLASGLALLGTSLAGAGENHYLEPALAWALLAPVGAAQLKPRWPTDSMLPALCCLYMSLVLLATLDIRHWQIADRKTDDYHDLVPMVQKKQVLTDIPYLAARTLTQEFVDATSLRYAEDVGRWSPEEVVQDLDDRTFEAVILHRPLDSVEDERYARLSRAIRKAIENNYGLCFQKDGAAIYGRREKGSSQTASCETLF